MLVWYAYVEQRCWWRRCILGCAQTCECCCAEASAGSRRGVVNGCYSLWLPRCIRNDFTHKCIGSAFGRYEISSAVSASLRLTSMESVFWGMTVHCFNSQISTAYLSDCIIIIVLNVNHLLVGLKSSETWKFNIFKLELFVISNKTRNSQKDASVNSLRMKWNQTRLFLFQLTLLTTSHRELDQLFSFVLHSKWKC